MSKARELSKLLSGTLKVGALQAPAGTTAQRPSGQVGQIRYNSNFSILEQYTPDGWQGIATPPLISNISPSSFNGEQGTSFTINGSSFDSTVSMKFITAQGQEYVAATLTRVNASQLIVTTPQDFTVANEPLKVRVINGSGLSYTLDNAIDCGAPPTWNTASGSLGVFSNSISTSVSASDPDAGSSISYSISSGALPSGVTLNSSTGAITGTNSTPQNTVYNFTVTATDNAGNTSSRAFSLTLLINYFGSAADGVGTY